MKRILWVVCSVLFLQNATAQLTDSSRLKISLLTCAPGSELYSTFGHTAIRIVDSSTQQDFVFNYGTFNFDEPGFYTKFVQGKLNFMLSVEPFNIFLEEYQETQRSVTEQTLNLTDKEKRDVADFLFHNYLPANRYYKYDFLYDNCATRIRDILFKNVPGVNINGSIVAANTTSRDLIYFYLDKAGQPWSKLGIDLLLGSKMDKVVDNNAAMFLPDFLRAGVKAATIHDKKYELEEHTIIDAKTPIAPSGKYTPLIVITIVSVVFLLVYLKVKNNFTLHLLDSLLLYITGLLGLLMLFMWFGTDHQTCADNYNLLWALPTNFIASFFIWKRRDWLRKYFFFTTIISAVLLAFWFGLPQHFNIALIPFVVLMMIRYGQLARKN